MKAHALPLPEGRRGQALALALLLLALLLLWQAALAPLLGWYQARDARLRHDREIAARMNALSTQIPALRAALAAAGSQAATTGILLDGKSDAIAGANLQAAVQKLAAEAGTNLDSVAMGAAQPAGALRRIGVQVSVTAPWPVLIALLEAIDTARPRMIVDSLSLDNVAPPGTDAPPSLQANFAVSGFRAGGGA